MLKKIGLSLVGLTILTPTIITTISCSNSNGSPTNNNSVGNNSNNPEKPTLTDKQIIDLLAQSFKVKEKSEGEILLVDANSITKENFFNYFEFVKNDQYQEAKYELIEVQTSSKNELKVKYEISYNSEKHNGEVTINEFNVLNDAYEKFEVTLKSGAQSNTLESSKIDQDNISNYYDFATINNSNIKYSWTSKEVKGEYEEELDIVFTISYKQKTKEKKVSLSGFKKVYHWKDKVEDRDIVYYIEKEGSTPVLRNKLSTIISRKSNIKIEGQIILQVVLNSITFEEVKDISFTKDNYDYTLYKVKVYPVTQFELFEGKKTLKELGYSGNGFTIDLAVSKSN